MVPCLPATVGTLERMGSGGAILLRSRALIGRSAVCDLRVDEPRVSGEHARLRWTGAVWEVRDLGSKNGTFLGDRRLAVGERVPLVAGDGFALGGAGPPAPVLVLADAAPPEVSVRHAPSGATRFASGGLIALPDDDHPEVSLVEGRDGRWVLEADGAPRIVADGESISAGGQAWTLDLPEGISSTQGASGVAPALAPALETIALRFAVSRDEERVELTVVCPDREIHLPPRSHHYLLVTLARARLAAAEAPPAERGFLDRDDLCRMLATDELRLNVDVCRARKQFAALGILGAANIVERRMGTGRIRLGVERVDVRRA
jgi:FHA domain